MHYSKEIYRPPFEAETPLLQITAGCSHNECSFCTMYRQTKFCVSPLEEVEEDLAEIAATRPDCSRIFLLNGDPFVLPAHQLLAVAEMAHKYLPKLETLTCYASFIDIKRKSDEDLRALRQAGFNDLNIGVESGYDPAIAQMNKGFTAAEADFELGRLEAAGISYNALLMIGVAGKGNSEANVQATARLLNAHQPHIVAPIGTSVTEGSPLADLRDAGEYVELSEAEMIEEEIALVEALQMDDDVLFFGSHFYNLAGVNGTFAQKDEILRVLRDELEEGWCESPDFMARPFHRSKM